VQVLIALILYSPIPTVYRQLRADPSSPFA